MKKYIIYFTALLVLIFFIAVLILGEKKLYINLNGDKVINLNINDKYKDKGVTVKYCNKYFKFICKNIDNRVIVSNNINNKRIGKYKVNYKIKDKNYVKYLFRIVNVLDIQSPNIELVSSDKNFCPNTEYIEEGYTAYDNLDGDITNKVIRKDLKEKIFYSVTDSSGNKKVIYRNLNYLDNEQPIIKLKGSNTIYLHLNQQYIEKGYEVNDNCDKDINNRVTVKTDLNNKKEGTYNIYYYVTDTNGNKSEMTRKVIVYNDTSKIEKNGKIIYLTFDDGPGVYTEKILDILKKYNVKATFFVTNQFSGFESLIKREYNEGHSIGVHTYSHNYKSIYKSIDDYINDFNTMNEIILNQTGEYSTIFRFPGGSSNTISRFNKGIMSDLVQKMDELGYNYYDWNLDSGDTSSKDPIVISNNVFNELKSKDRNEYIVLMHDIKKANLESLDLIITYCLDNGYTFLPINTNTGLVHHKVNN